MMIDDIQERENLEVPTPTRDWRDAFGRRASLLLLLVIIWCAVLGIRFYKLMEARQTTPESQSSWRVYTIPAMRGRILDQSGIPLAWSEREIDLVYRKANHMDQIWKDLYLLEDRMGLKADAAMKAVVHCSSRVVILKRSLNADEICRVAEVSRRCTRVILRNRFVRHHIEANARILQWLGETRQYGRRQVGVSGIEQKLNQVLLGQDGQFRVMVDRDGNWVPGTWTQIQSPRAGYDRYVNFRLKPRRASGLSESASAE